MSKKQNRKSKKHSRKGKKHSRKHVGGSQASDLVMGYVSNPGHSVEYPGVPKLAGNVDEIGKMLYKTTGGGCGCSGNNSNTKKMMSGGSRNSDMVMAYASKVAQAGGRRKGSKKSKKSMRSMRSKRSIRGGGSTAIRDTLYSRVYNGGRTDDAPFFNAFTNEEYLSQDFLANQEPNLGANPPYIE